MRSASVATSNVRTVQLTAQTPSDYNYDEDGEVEWVKGEEMLQIGSASSSAVPSSVVVKQESSGTSPLQSVSSAPTAHGHTADDEEIDTSPHFSLRMESMKTFFSVVSALYDAKKDQIATIVVNKRGIRISNENTSKTMYRVAYIGRSLFDVFDLVEVEDDAEIILHVNIHYMLECLLLYGPQSLQSTTLAMAYKVDSPELGIILENGGITSEISLTTVHWESDSGSFGTRERSVWESVFRQSEMSMKLVIKSEALLDALKSVCETMGGSTVHVSFGQEGLHLLGTPGPFVRLHSSCLGGSITSDISSNSMAVEVLDVYEEQIVSRSYSTALIAHNLRALGESSLSYWRINSSGMSNVSHRIDSQDGNEGAAFISFLFSPDFLEAESFESESTPQSEQTQSQISEYSLTPQSQPAQHYRYDSRFDSVRSSHMPHSAATSDAQPRTQHSVQSQSRPGSSTPSMHHLQQGFHRSEVPPHVRGNNAGDTTEDEVVDRKPVLSQNQRVRTREYDHQDDTATASRARYVGHADGTVATGHSAATVDVGSGHPYEFDNQDY